jgi:predicted DNA-binding transcriptional regulator AlpA
MEGIRLSGERTSLPLASAYPASFNERKPMRTTPRRLADAREELVQIQEEFTHVQKRIDTVRDCVTDSLTRIFGEERPAFAGLQEEAFMERVAERVVARLKARPNAPVHGGSRYVREKEAAAYLGVSVFTLQSWRSRGEPCSPPFTKVGSMVMYSVKELEQFMEQRTVERR